jgi:hypothetical protein
MSRLGFLDRRHRLPDRLRAWLQATSRSTFAWSAGATAAVIVLNSGPGESHDHVLGLEALAGPIVLRVGFYDPRGTGLSTGPRAQRWTSTPKPATSTPSAPPSARRGRTCSATRFEA